MSFIGDCESILWSDIDERECFPNARPILAHYTAISTIESILRNRELWLSHPLLMNDHEEMRWGLIEGNKQFMTHRGLEEACGTVVRHRKLLSCFEERFTQFSTVYAYNIFIGCFCQHRPDDQDGLLSMWRAYGANAGGAALVVDTSKLIPKDDSPLLLHPVTYSSTENRRAWIDNKLNQLSETIFKLKPEDNLLDAAAHAFMERLKIFSIFTKHKGFEEEREWRLAYLSDRDLNDTYKAMIGYAVIGNGIQPKLKLKLNRQSNDVQADLSDIVTDILLGPTVGAPLSVMAMRLMLKTLGEDRLAERITTSTTPFRT